MQNAPASCAIQNRRDVLKYKMQCGSPPVFHVALGFGGVLAGYRLRTAYAILMARPSGEHVNQTINVTNIFVLSNIVLR